MIIWFKYQVFSSLVTNTTKKILNSIGCFDSGFEINELKTTLLDAFSPFVSIYILALERK